MLRGMPAGPALCYAMRAPVSQIPAAGALELYYPASIQNLFQSNHYPVQHPIDRQIDH
jgi:hypothetical protein